MLVRMSETGLVVITSHDCHLCDHARAVLDDLGLQVREVDVASEEAPALAPRGVPLAFLPVLWDGEKVLAYGRVSRRRLAKDLVR